MEALLDAITEIVALISREKISAIANRIRNTDSKSASLSEFASNHKVAAAIDRLKNTWLVTNVGASELAAMLIAASHAIGKVNAEQTVELVWTGPTTPFVSARRTEQALLQVIESARKALFITSFVAYDISSIVNALNHACERGVVVSMLLESSQLHGGSIAIDVIGKISTLVPEAKLYAWRDKASEFADGRVHAKVAVADSDVCFITSANLTGFAMERNMEAGLLITGGRVPTLLANHLNSLVTTKVISAV